MTSATIPSMKPRPWTIYGLADPRNLEVRYVGANFRGKARYNEHLCRARKGCRRHVYCWIRSLLKIGLLPVYVPLEQGEGLTTWEEAEMRWIEKLNTGGRLCNHTKGGDGTPGYVPSPELRALWSKQRRGKKYPLGRRSGMLGKKHSPEACRKISEAGTGRSHSEASRRLLSDAAKQRGISAEQSRRMA